MATIRPKVITRYLLDGKQVPKGTPGATVVREETAKYYGWGIPGVKKGTAVPLATDKTAAQRMLDKMVRDAERGMTDLPAANLHRAALSVLIDEFKGDVELGLASKTRTRRKPDAKQSALVVQRVRDALAGCGFQTVADLNDAAPAKLARHLNARVALLRKDGGLSHQSAAFVLAAVGRFAWWLSTRKKAPVRADLFADVPGFDPANERVHARRDCTCEELATILDAALTSNSPFKKMSGPDRYMLYLTAFATGFRANELASLTPDSFDLAAEPPRVALRGKMAKNKKVANPPLPLAVAVQLARHLAGKPAGERVWPGAWYRHGARMLRKDLKAAGVPYAVEVNGEVRYLDFHGLRHSFITALAAAGVGPRELQELARHSDPRLTLGVYTRSTPHQLAGAVGRLPVPGGDSPSPFARLTRAQVEAALTDCLARLGATLSPTGEVQLLPVASPVAPGMALPGDGLRRAGTTTAGGTIPTGRTKGLKN